MIRVWNVGIRSVGDAKEFKACYVCGTIFASAETNCPDCGTQRETFKDNSFLAVFNFSIIITLALGPFGWFIYNYGRLPASFDEYIFGVFTIYKLFFFWL